jgi:hypothetical protein
VVVEIAGAEDCSLLNDSDQACSCRQGHVFSIYVTNVFINKYIHNGLFTTKNPSRSKCLEGRGLRPSASRLTSQWYILSA